MVKKWGRRVLSSHQAEALVYRACLATVATTITAAMAMAATVRDRADRLEPPLTEAEWRSLASRDD